MLLGILKARKKDAVCERLGVPAALLAALGGACSVIATFAIVGSLSRHLLVWPTSGFLIALLLPCAYLRRHRQMLINVTGGLGALAGGLIVGMPIWVAITIAGMTTIDLAIASLLLTPYVRTFDDLKVRENGLRLLLVTILAPLASTLLGVVPLASFMGTPKVLMAALLILADALGIALFVPAMLLAQRRKRSSAGERRRKLLPVVLSACFFLVDCVGTFWQTTGPFLFLIFPATILLLLITGIEGAVFSSMVLGAVGWVATSHGHGPIWLERNPSPQMRMISLQLFTWVSTITSITVGMALDERRASERFAKKSLRVQQAILEHTRDALVLSSLDGAERYASPAIQQITGWTPEEYLVQESTAMVHPEDQDLVLQMIEGLRNGIPQPGSRYRIMHKNGGWSWVEASISPYGDRKVEGYVGVIRDIAGLIETERGWVQERRVLSAEQQRLTEAGVSAQYQLKLRDEFLSHVSHELRSPLTSIYSFCSIVADGLAGETTAEQNEYLEIVMKNVAQLQAMIEDLLTVTQSREGKLAIQQQRTSATEAVADSMEMVGAFARRKNISFMHETDQDIAEVYADPVRLRQILIILLDNGVKFTPEGGTIRVVLSRRAGLLLTQVIDTGNGIAQDKWVLIFNKLYQVENTDKTESFTASRTGLGLGLHIARTLVCRQGGHIWVTSKPGEGSVFSFTLPLYRGQDQPAAEILQLEDQLAMLVA